MTRIRAMVGTVMRRIRAGRGSAAGGGGGSSGTVNIALFTIPWPSDVTLSVSPGMVLLTDIASSSVGNHYVQNGYVETGYVS
jgi:hypothetical protein